MQRQDGDTERKGIALLDPKRHPRFTSGIFWYFPTSHVFPNQECVLRDDYTMLGETPFIYFTCVVAVVV